MTTENRPDDTLPPNQDNMPPAPPPKGEDRNLRRFFKTLPRWVYAVAAGTIIAGGAAIELNTSFLQSRLFNGAAHKHRSYSETQPIAAPPPPAAHGPYDVRLGYTQSEAFRAHLEKRDYERVGAAEPQDARIAGIPLFPIYNEKAQAGLKITDANKDTLYAATFPRDAYADFDSIPPLVVNSLLFVENRELLEQHPDTWNPAIEWSRFAKALMGYGLKKAGVHEDRAGGSTLATQIEKFRHSPGGVTGSGTDKLQQMLSASARAYQDGPNTVEARRRIVLDYLNSMPLSSYPGFGEVNGFADGMNLWFGRDFTATNTLLRQDETKLSDDQLKDYATAYRESLSLVMAVKKPSAYLLSDREELQDRIDKFLPLMVQNHVISARLEQAVLAARPEFADRHRRLDKPELPSKSAMALQADLLRDLDIRGMYELNRIDLTAQTTIDVKADAAVSKILHQLNDPAFAAASGMTGYQLLKPDMTGDIVYSFTLYEKTGGENVLRVQTDNFNGPLNLNEGTKLELGSTAKLRTLVSYLEAMSDLHAEYAGQDAETLRAVKVAANDHITRWALDYLADPATDKSLNAMLEGALNRTYSGSPGESFFTGGGVHHFENFEHNENYQNYTVKDAFHHSVNLSFIRIMRDLVYYTEDRKMKIDGDIFDNPESPQRKAYLEQFADQEGTGFMWKFWKQEDGKLGAELDSALAAKTHRTPPQLAVLFRSLHPEAPAADMEAFIRKESTSVTEKTDFAKLYADYAVDKFNLNDRGYITHIHPLELWMASYRTAHPDAKWDEVKEAGKDVRQESYKWLMRPEKMHAQNLRIQTMLEQEAFAHIQQTWESKGYPFKKMVPSYASALGASGDTPAALATLSGILQNDGIMRPAIKFSDLTLGEDTPYMQEFKPKHKDGTRVLPEELTKLVRREMQGVVEQGTAKRAYNSVKLSDGRILPVGGKTGTGDNRLQSFTAGGAIKSSDAKSRTATFVFAIDDRFYGCVTAYVAGPHAGEYKFTSALAAQVFKTVAPALQPMLDRAYGVTPPANTNEAVKDMNAVKPAVKTKTPGMG